MKKVVYIIPGYGDSGPKDPDYLKVSKIFEDKGIAPIYVKIHWTRKKKSRFSDYADEFLKVYEKKRGTQTYVYGFSFGATIAFLTAAKTKPKALILSSLSPYFMEDRPRLKASWLRWYKENFVESDYVFSDIASGVRGNTRILVGEKEGPESMARAKDAKKKLANSKLTVVKGARHDASQKQYVEALEKLVRNL